MANKKVLTMIMALILIFVPITGTFASNNYTTLGFGSSGNEVTKLQGELKTRGYLNDSIDGIYGKNTENAVIEFQRKNELAIDGIAGVNTLSKLYASNSKGYVLLAFGSKGNEVTKLQQALKNKGFHEGAVDGIYGKATEKSVIEYQKYSKLAIDGIAGTDTQTALYSQSDSNSTGTNNYTDDDLFWLARIIEAESGGEPYNGKVAVGNVILNRVNSGDFPNTIYGVIFEYYGNIPQFSPVAEGTIYNTPSQESIRAAKDALNGAKPVGNSTYFFNPDKAAGTWIVNNKAYLTRIGGHTFYI